MVLDLQQEGILFYKRLLKGSFDKYDDDYKTKY
jgi:hypothetical protein